MNVWELIKKAKEKGVCSVCGAVADKFDNDLSYEEYTMSGLCQECQNKLFKEDEEDEQSQNSCLCSSNAYCW